MEENRKKKNKKLSLIILLLLLLLIGSIAIFSLRTAPDLPFLSTDENAEDWKGNQDLSKPNTDYPKIAIPGITSLVFTADTKEQKVNFYNPEENDCLFHMTLYIEDVPYWESGNVEPGKGYYNITLTDTLAEGDYDAYLLVECFKANGAELNSASVDFTLSVE